MSKKSITISFVFSSCLLLNNIGASADETFANTTEYVEHLWELTTENNENIPVRELASRFNVILKYRTIEDCKQYKHFSEIEKIFNEAGIYYNQDTKKYCLLLKNIDSFLSKMLSYFNKSKMDQNVISAEYNALLCDEELKNPIWCDHTGKKVPFEDIRIIQDNDYNAIMEKIIIFFESIQVKKHLLKTSE